MFADNIGSVKDVKRFFTYLARVDDLKFHPDNTFDEYVGSDGIRLFSIEQCKHYDALMRRSFEVCEREGVDIYEIGLEIVLESICV
ncbi:MAG: hypothetical protein ACYSWO_21070 [Planctomycetota bacterium]|jgi:hypothetical protein